MTHRFTPLATADEQRVQRDALLRRAQAEDRAAAAVRAGVTATGAAFILATGTIHHSPWLLAVAGVAGLLTFALARRLWWTRAEHDSYVTHLVNAGTLERTPAS